MFKSFLLGGLASCIILYRNSFNWFSWLFSVAAFFYIWGGPEYWKYVYKTIGRDTRALFRFLRIKWYIYRAKRRDACIPKLFQDRVRQHPNKIAFYFEDESWTFQQLEHYSNQIGNYFKTRGIKHGDSVALLLENRIEYIGIWLGLTKLGAVPALLNTNLRQKSLMHCIDIVDSKAVICGQDFQDAILEIKEDLKDISIYVFGSEGYENKIPASTDLSPCLKGISTAVPPEIDSVHFTDKMVYIYTSGTTGLPKAAVIKHSRAAFAAVGMSSLVGINGQDTIYNALPMYHTVGGIIGTGMCLCEGATVAIRRKFSASNFWKDCAKYKCTVAQYIGELCRYLLNTPEAPEDSQHKVRVMFGNGLRPQIWEQFQKRFNVPVISEFYGSTEGNANIINMDGKLGAIGFVSVIIPKFYPCTLIKIDEETGKPLKSDDGMCIRCKPGEPGEFVGRIIRNDPVRDFHGYADKKATESKIVENVWQKGDLAFLSGDILVMDEEGYLYFKDRRGDTFRWKGENVSTTEIEGIISQTVQNSDAVVYGVEVPGAEGRAGMAAILDPESKVDVAALAIGINKSLPAYARPLFLRIVTKLDMTGTYKLKKTTLKEEGFDVTKVKDKLYFLDSKTKTYVPLTNDVHTQIHSGAIRF